jgi:hypothetical protein
LDATNSSKHWVWRITTKTFRLIPLWLQDAFFFIQHKVRDRKRKGLHICINLVISVANTYNFIDINSHSWKFWLFWSMISHRIDLFLSNSITIYGYVEKDYTWMESILRLHLRVNERLRYHETLQPFDKRLNNITNLH